MEMMPVNSSHIEKIGHDGQNTMFIQFKGGRQYRYDGVSPDDFAGLQNAESKGRYLRTMGVKGVRVEE